jgi:hypothetical protein
MMQMAEARDLEHEHNHKLDLYVCETLVSKLKGDPALDFFGTLLGELEEKAAENFEKHF